MKVLDLISRFCPIRIGRISVRQNSLNEMRIETQHPGLMLPLLVRTALACVSASHLAPQISRRPTGRSTLEQNCKNGSSSQQRKRHIGQRNSILTHSACMAQDYPRTSRGPDLQACKEGCNTIPDRRGST